MWEGPAGSSCGSVCQGGGGRPFWIMTLQPSEPSPLEKHVHTPIQAPLHHGGRSPGWMTVEELKSLASSGDHGPVGTVGIPVSNAGLVGAQTHPVQPHSLLSLLAVSHQFSFVQRCQSQMIKSIPSVAIWPDGSMITSFFLPWNCHLRCGHNAAGR